MSNPSIVAPITDISSSQISEDAQPSIFDHLHKQTELAFFVVASSIIPADQLKKIMIDKRSCSPFHLYRNPQNATTFKEDFYSWMNPNDLAQTKPGRDFLDMVLALESDNFSKLFSKYLFDRSFAKEIIDHNTIQMYLIQKEVEGKKKKLKRLQTSIKKENDKQKNLLDADQLRIRQNLEDLQKKMKIAQEHQKWLENMIKNNNSSSKNLQRIEDFQKREGIAEGYQDWIEKDDC